MLIRYAYYVLYVPVVPHKAVAEVAKIGNLEDRFVVVSPGWPSKSSDGSKSGWRHSSVVVVVVCLMLSIYLAQCKVIKLNV